MMHDSMPTYDERLQSTLERIGVHTPPGLEEIEHVCIFKDDTVISFLNPKVEVSIQANTWVVSGSPQVQNLHDILLLLPCILNQLGMCKNCQSLHCFCFPVKRPENLPNLKKLAEQLQKQKIGTDPATAHDDDDEVPEHVAGETDQKP
ncbi:putative nascent polypeptide-associated complex NAC domain, NAC A/B domain superfamily [Helianthus annuus]|nr:putative nascent polypeptide-associated complex NAC domain, NAC A/B domain superfamily [Helianthus annuus]